MALIEVTQELADALATVAPVYEFVPEVFTPPAIMLTPSDSYITKRTGNRFSEYTLSYRLALVVDGGTNEVMSDAIIQLLDDVLGAVESVDWNVGPVDGYGIETVNGHQYLTAGLEVNNTYRRSN